MDLWAPVTAAVGVLLGAAGVAIFLWTQSTHSRTHSSNSSLSASSSSPACPAQNVNLSPPRSLVEEASIRSQVPVNDAFAIDKVNLYERLGKDTFVALSTAFYTRVFQDQQQWFRDIFKDSNKEESIQNQYEFLIQRMGGPPLYSQRRGHPALIRRHVRFALSNDAAVRWLFHMKAAMEEVKAIDEDSRSRMLAYFAHTAYFLVVGHERASVRTEDSS